MTDLKNKILEQIKTGELKQTSRWYFISKDYFFWLVTLLAVVVGSVAVSSICYQVVYEHLPRLQEMPTDMSFFKTLFMVMPYFWLLVLLALIGVAWFNYKNTKRAYRHHNGLIVALVVIISLIFGGGLCLSGVAQKMEDGMRKAMPYYRQEVEYRINLRDQMVQDRMQQLRRIRDEQERLREKVIEQILSTTTGDTN